MNDAIMMMMGGGVAPETKALIDRFSTPPTGSRLKIIDNLVRALKANGVWSRIDALYILAAADSQAALLNWKGAIYNATNNGASFSADDGFTGDGAAAYIATGYEPGDGQFTPADRHFGSFLKDSIAPNADAIGVNGPTSAQKISIGSSTSGTTINDGSVAFSGGLSSVANFAVSRVGSTSSVYRNGSLLGTFSSIAATPAYGFHLLATNDAGTANGFSAARIVAAHFGASLTAAQAAALNTALQAYMTAVGA